MPDEEWWDRAACRGAPLDVFITSGDEDDDPMYPPQEAMAYCEMCPVLPDCLEWAMKNDLVGVWGGTTDYQRQQLKRVRERPICLSCGATNMIVSGTIEFCICCGMSWWIV